MDAEGADAATKEAEVERVAEERAKRAMWVKPFVAKWRAVWDPIMGPVPTMKMVLVREGMVLGVYGMLGRCRRKDDDDK